jgi:hypothetical protein
MVSFWTENDTSLQADHLNMEFRLMKGDTLFYVSNAIDFPLNTNEEYTLEFGGAIEGTDYRPRYDVKGYLRARDSEGQNIMTCTTETRYVEVIQKTSFSNTMHIEYDCQQDWELPSSSFAKLTAAFHVADTDTDFFRDQVTLPEECIWWDSLPRYHVIHFSNTSPYNMHLLAVEGLWENSAKQEIIIGASIPGPLGFSYVFIADICDWHYPNDPNVMALATIHELGHQRADLTEASVVVFDPENPPHPELHDSPFCAMNQNLWYVGNNDNDPYNDPPGLKRWFDRNPHFCEMCVNSIRNVSW